METWDQMTRRHARERREMVETLAAMRITQSEAAQEVNTTLTCLNNYVRRNDIPWPVKGKGGAGNIASKPRENKGATQ